jgi:hypothetical protein
MNNWETHYLLAQEFLAIMDRNAENRAAKRASKPRGRLLPRIDVRRWVTGLKSPAGVEDTPPSISAIPDAECA